MHEPQRHVTPTVLGPLVRLEAGAGTAVVLLHGIGSSAASWGAQFAGHLPDKHRLIAWNAPGYGGSVALSAPTPLAAEYAAARAELLTFIGVTRLHLVGHSLGALIAARFAADHPDAIMSLSLSSCAMGHARLAADDRARLLASRLDDIRDLGPERMAQRRGPRLVRPGAPDAVRNVVIENMAGVDPQGYAQAAHMLSRGDLLADVERMPADMPVQILCGALDVITPPEVNQRLAATRPGTPFTLIPEAGHAVYLEQPAAFDAALLAFIEAHDER